MKHRNKFDITTEDVVRFSQFWFKFFPYDYQIKFLHACLHSNRVLGKFPRQSGKSQTVAVYALVKALLSRVQILIVAPTQTQSKELYEKIRVMISDSELNAFLVKSTETEMKFDNGSRIISLPAGPRGDTIRGFTADIVIIEEAGIMKDNIINTVIIPMLASKGKDGQIIKIGTPLTKNHFYHSCFEDSQYAVVTITWRDVVLAGHYHIDFIKEQKKKLLTIQFKTEYESEFIDDISSFFTIKLINSAKEDYKLLDYIIV